MAAESEKIYECQVKRRRLKTGGGYEPFWKASNPSPRPSSTTTPSSSVPTAPARSSCIAITFPARPPPHIAHKLKTDSEYCPSGLYFRKATDGRQPRLSEHPVR